MKKVKRRKCGHYCKKIGNEKKNDNWMLGGERTKAANNSQTTVLFYVACSTSNIVFRDLNI